MERTNVNGADLEYESRGSGEPVVFIHGAMAVAFSPLLVEGALKDYRTVVYNRRGFGGSTRSDTASIGQHAADCRQLMRFLGIERAHVVGHSSGALIALQMTLDDPSAVHSLTLMETAVPSVMFAVPEVGAAVENALAAYRAGNKAGALDAFMRGFVRPDYGDVIGKALGPQAFEGALASLDTLFQVEFPALQDWSFTPADAARIRQPVLLVLGGASLPYWRQIDEQMRAWLPQAESFVLPGADHLLMVREPRLMAGALAGFLGRHPL
jgi:pimeloyl-ACP methyl ester carboxylesterase